MRFGLLLCVFCFLPSSSSESIARDEPRFQRKLRNGLFERVRERRPIFNEPPLLDVNGSVDDNGVDRRWSESMMSRATHAHAKWDTQVAVNFQFNSTDDGVDGTGHPERVSERADGYVCAVEWFFDWFYFCIIFGFGSYLIGDVSIWSFFCFVRFLMDEIGAKLQHN